MITSEIFAIPHQYIVLDHIWTHITFQLSFVSISFSTQLEGFFIARLRKKYIVPFARWYFDGTVCFNNFLSDKNMYLELDDAKWEWRWQLLIWDHSISEREKNKRWRAPYKKLKNEGLNEYEMDIIVCFRKASKFNYVVNWDEWNEHLLEWWTE